MVIDARASLAHFVDHMLPVWRALPSEARGTFWMRRKVFNQFIGANPDLNLRAWDAHPPEAGLLTLVASWQDLKGLDGKPAIRMEHGAAQSYRGDRHNVRACEHPSYTGGLRNDNVILFLCPAQRTADEWKATYPKAKVAVIGCPRLDGYAVTREITRNNERNRVTSGKILLTWTWGSTLCPETESARTYFTPALPALAKAFPGRVVGTGHPRAAKTIQRTYDWAGIPWVESGGEAFGDLLRTTALVLADNTSLAWEASALGIPVLWLDKPEYRRRVIHGLRFWEFATMFCDHPDFLHTQVLYALSEHALAAESAKEIGGRVYDGLIDGKSSERAALAILGAM